MWYWYWPLSTTEHRNQLCEEWMVTWTSLRLLKRRVLPYGIWASSWGFRWSHELVVKWARLLSHLWPAVFSFHCSCIDAQRSVSPRSPWWNEGALVVSLNNLGPSKRRASTVSCTFQERPEDCSQEAQWISIAIAMEHASVPVASSEAWKDALAILWPSVMRDALPLLLRYVFNKRLKFWIDCELIFSHQGCWIIGHCDLQRG